MYNLRLSHMVSTAYNLGWTTLFIGNKEWVSQCPTDLAMYYAASILHVVFNDSFQLEVHFVIIAA